MQRFGRIDFVNKIAWHIRSISKCQITFLWQRHWQVPPDSVQRFASKWRGEHISTLETATVKWNSIIQKDQIRDVLLMIRCTRPHEVNLQNDIAHNLKFTSEANWKHNLWGTEHATEKFDVICYAYGDNVHMNAKIFANDNECFEWNWPDMWPNSLS